MKRSTPEKRKMARSPTVMKEMFNLIENEKSRSPKNIQHSQKNTIFCFQCAKKWVHITSFGLLDNSVCVTADPEKCSTCDLGTSVSLEPYKREQSFMLYSEIANTSKVAEDKYI